MRHKILIQYREKMSSIRDQVFTPVFKVVNDVLDRIQRSWAFKRAKEKLGQKPEVHVSLTKGSCS